MQPNKYSEIKIKTIRSIRINIKIASDDSDVHGKCEKAQCGCMKGAFMCGKEVGKVYQIIWMEERNAFFFFVLSLLIMLLAYKRHVGAGKKCKRAI
jgi:hypothetical protein